MRRADRLFQLVQLLRSRKQRTAAELGDELRVSTRTVYRDVADLIGSGVPIEGEPGVGYRLRRGYELPPLTFNAEEIESLVLGARMVQAWADDELAQAASSALTKIEAVVPEPLRSSITNSTLFAVSGAWARAMATELGLLRRAIADRRKLRFRYRREDGESSERIVRPLGLYFFGAKWLLASYCEMRADYRSFRVDRMDQHEQLDETFDPSDGIDLRTFLLKVASRT
jgi:predicted DNA-binding transcriptional regulator YafY